MGKEKVMVRIRGFFFALKICILVFPYRFRIHYNQYVLEKSKSETS